jgi:hypothetical protein
MQIHTVAAHRDALFNQERALLPSPREASVEADYSVPWEAIVDGRENVPDEARRGRVDVAICANKPSRDRTYSADDAIRAQCNAGRVPLNPATQIPPAFSRAYR